MLLTAIRVSLIYIVLVYLQDVKSPKFSTIICYRTGSVTLVIHRQCFTLFQCFLEFPAFLLQEITTSRNYCFQELVLSGITNSKNDFLQETNEISWSSLKYKKTLKERETFILIKKCVFP